MNRNEEGAINRDPTPSQNDASKFARASAPAPKPPIDIYKRVFRATEGLCGGLPPFFCLPFILNRPGKINLREYAQSSGLFGVSPQANLHVFWTRNLVAATLNQP